MVFAFQGGLYDRIYEGKNRLELSVDVKRQMILISEDIAYLLFCANTLSIGMVHVNKLIKEKYPSRIKDFTLGNYYEINGKEITFVHRTIQEFFVCRYFTRQLEEILLLYQNNLNSDECAKALVMMFQSSNYIYLRLEEQLYYHIVNCSSLCEKKTIAEFKYLMPKIFEFYFTKFENLTNEGSISRYRQSQNCLSAICKIANIVIGDYWCQLLRNDKYFLLFLKTKQYVNLDLNGLVYEDEDLSAIYFRKSIKHSNFKKCNLCRCDFKKTTIRNCDFKETTFISSYAEKTTFEHAELINVDFSFVDNNNGRFDNCFIDELQASHANFLHTRFEDTIMKNSCFHKSEFGFAGYFNITIENTDFFECSFDSINFEKVFLKNVRFIKCKFSKILTVTTQETGGIHLRNCYFDDLFIEIKDFVLLNEFQEFMDFLSITQENNS